MKVVLDECLPRKLKRYLPGYDVSTVPEMNWAGIKNGNLLKLMEPVVDVFITIDGNLEYQQNLASIRIGLIVLSAPDNTIETLAPLSPQIVLALQSIQPGKMIRISA